MQIDIIARIIVTLSLLSQLWHVIKVNKQIFPIAFICYSFGSYLMAYNYYLSDMNNLTNRVMFKLFNSTVILLIGLLTMK